MCRGNLKKLSCKACTNIVCFEEKVSCSKSSNWKKTLSKVCLSLAVEAAARRTNCVAAAAQETGSMGGD